jgi:hypothetical protein
MSEVKKDHVLALVDNRMRNLATNQSMNSFKKLRYYKNGVLGYFLIQVLVKGKISKGPLSVDLIWKLRKCRT